MAHLTRVFRNDKKRTSIFKIRLSQVKESCPRDPQKNNATGRVRGARRGARAASRPARVANWETRAECLKAKHNLAAAAAGNDESPGGHLETPSAHKSDSKPPWPRGATFQKQRHFRKNKAKKHKNPDPFWTLFCPLFKGVFRSNGRFKVSTCGWYALPIPGGRHMGWPPMNH